MARPELIEAYIRRRKNETRATIREIVLQGNPILRQRAAEVTNINDPTFQQLLTDLEATMFHYGGMGIAAPQVAVSSRVFVFSSWPHRNYEDAPEILPRVAINPVITGRHGEMRPDWERCLSVPELRGQVPRLDEIEVAYLDQDAQLIKERLLGFPARLFQHELDHLDGILFPDIPGIVVVSETEYQQMRR